MTAPYRVRWYRLAADGANPDKTIECADLAEAHRVYKMVDAMLVGHIVMVERWSTVDHRSVARELKHAWRWCSPDSIETAVAALMGVP